MDIGAYRFCQDRVSHKRRAGKRLELHTQLESYILNYLSKVEPPWLVVGGWALLATLVGLLIMAADKGRAQRGEWRFSEKLLIEIAFAGGCLGVFGVMVLFEHKTEKPLFMGLAMGALCLWFFIFHEMTIFLGPPIR